MEYVWIAVMVAAIAMEGATTGLVAIWFLPASALSLILAICRVPWPIQVTVFVVVSLLCVIFARPFFAKRTHRVATNVDSLIGEKVVVTERIENLAGRGQVKIARNNQGWSARSISDDVNYEEGEILRVVAIEGVKLICQK
jgi:membrane protein implicated in regulation of membrane protease activity